jgi:uncharacterized protein YndB with AHSA1/START domain
MSAKTSDTTDREIVISRVVDAPRELVWEAMTNPQHIIHWWGPRGFSTTIEQMDVRPGGAWKQIMHGPDGANYPNSSTFHEVVKPERIVYSLGGGREGAPAHHFVSTWTFNEIAPNKTKVTIHMVFPTAVDRDKVVKEFGAIEGGKQTLERLSEYLPKLKTDDRDFVIERTFDAPRDLVFKAWTDPVHMAQWWGPRGFTNPICQLDVRPGSAWRIVMVSPDGEKHPAKGVYREIVPPERIVMTVDHSDLSDQWHDMINPDRDKSKPKPTIEAVTTVTFDDLAGKTKLTIRMRFESPAVRDSLLKIGMNQGWSQSLDRLGELLAKAK